MKSKRFKALQIASTQPHNSEEASMLRTLRDAFVSTYDTPVPLLRLT
ncbi:MAG: hypothetical protein PUI65_04495 [Prevotella sp.]|nr:hypothetical protein [Prevotella sp.]